MRIAVSASLLILFAALPLSGATFDRVSDRDLLDRADLVVVAKVLDANARLTPERDVYTDTRLQVEDVLKGAVAGGDVVIVSQLGGFAEGRGILVPGSATYTPGERVVAFLRKAPDGTYYTAYMGLGRFRFARQSNGRDVLVRDSDGIEIDADDAFDPRPAKEFIEAIRAGVPERAPKLAVESDAKPARVGSDAAPTAYLSQVSGNALRWAECQPNCTLSFIVNNVHPVVNTTLGLDRAFDAWSDDPNSFVTLSTGGIGADSGRTNDGENDVVFAWDGSNPHSACEGSKGCGILYFNGPTETHTYRGFPFWSIESADVIVHQSVTTQTAFEAVLTHEVGHGLGFRHSDIGTPSSSNAIMRSTVPTGGGATLLSWDKEAMAEVYGNGLPCAAAAITSVTSDSTVEPGGTKRLVVNATGTAPLTYQWYEGASGDTSKPVGTNDDDFTTPPLTSTKQYWVRVTNACGSVNSSTITVTVAACEKPVFVTQPQSSTVQPNGTATLTVAATSSTSLTYKWYQGALGDTTTLLQSGSDKTSFTTPPLTQTTSYWVRATNTCGDTDSQLATVTVTAECIPVAITGQPTNVNAGLGQGATLNVTVSGTGPVTFQWYSGDSGDESQPIANATASSLPVGPFNTAGFFKYWVKASNVCNATTTSVNSATIIITVECAAASTPEIAAPAASHYTVPYDVTWTGDEAVTPTFEVQEATNDGFTANVKTFIVTGAKKKTIDPHLEIENDTRFYYRVRGINSCTSQPTSYSAITSVIVTRPQPQDSGSFLVSIPASTKQAFTQDLLVPGFGESANNGDTFSISIDVPWVTVFPPSGALSAGGTTVQLTINPAPLDIGTTTATIIITRTPGGAGGNLRTNSTTTVKLPFSVSLVTPVTPTPRGGSAPPGTLIIPAVAHADGIGTRFQSDVRIVNVSDDPIEYEISFTPSGQNGAIVGKQTTLTIGANDVKAFDDIVKAWYGAGVLGEFGIGTIEIRPLDGANPLATFAASRTYAVETSGTYGQFIPAIRIDDFIGSLASDSLSKISLQQVANSTAYRTNVGFVEGSGSHATVIASLFDGNDNLLQTVERSLQPFGHEQLSFAQLFGGANVADGRIEVTVASETGKATAYASVIDNATSDPLMVFPEQALRNTAKQYVVPGIAELDNGAASNFHSDMRIYNAGNEDVTVTLEYIPQTGDPTPRPAAVQRVVAAGKVTAIDNVLPELWNLTRTGGAVRLTTTSDASLVVTARTFSRDAENGTYGQFIPGVAASGGIGAGERSMHVLQLEESEQYRTNVGLFEVTGQPVRVEIVAHKPDSKISAVTAVDLGPNQFIQFGRIFAALGLPTVYNGRIAVKVLEGSGRVAAYGSVIDNRTVDPTYVPAQ